jgi:hypothetical protein
VLGLGAWSPLKVPPISFRYLHVPRSRYIADWAGREGAKTAVDKCVFADRPGFISSYRNEDGNAH